MNEAVIQKPIPQKLEFHQVATLLPYGPPWLLIDAVDEWSEEGIVVRKAISGSEVNMLAHLKEGPSIMPGVLQIELVNQSLMLLMALLNISGKRSDSAQGVGVLARCKASFHSPAWIGEVITARVVVDAVVGSKTKFTGELSATARRIATIEGYGAQVHQLSAEA